MYKKYLPLFRVVGLCSVARGIAGLRSVARGVTGLCSVARGVTGLCSVARGIAGLFTALSVNHLDLDVRTRRDKS